MKRRLIFALLVPFAACFFASENVIAQGGDQGGWFPYETGRFWLYEGTVDYLEAASEEPVHRTVTWVTRVEDAVVTENWRAALVRDMPWQASWFEEAAESELDLIVMDREGRIFEPAGIDARLAFWKLRARKPVELPASLTGSLDLAMKRGMKAGDVFGLEPGQADVTPGQYNFVVESVETDTGAVAEAIRPQIQGGVFHLSFRSRPDHTNKHFAPGVGYVEFEYGHHGTPGDCHLKLVNTGMDPEGRMETGATRLGESVNEAGAPVTTFRFVREFLDATAADDAEEGLGDLLEDEIDWFGTRKTRAEVVEEERAYYQKWPLRQMTLSGDRSVEALADGGFRFHYILDYVAANLETAGRRQGRVKSEMIAGPDDSGKWRVRSLRSLGSVARDSEVVPGEKVGPVTRDSTVESLEKALGEDAVVTETVRNELEGIDETFSTLFAGTPKEMTVFWEDGRPVRVTVRREDSPWRSPDGLGVGSSLSEVEFANGMPFGLFGFEWDYGGTVASWRGGKLARAHAIGRYFSAWFRYDEAADRAVLEKVLGDSVFSSSDPAMRELAPRIGGVEFLFPAEPLHIGGLAEGQDEIEVEWMLEKVSPEKGEDALWGADGLYHQDWNFAGFGIVLSMISEKPGGSKSIGSVKVTAPCPLETERGIRIGSTWREVALAYADLYAAEDSDPEKFFVAGSIFGGLMFRFENGRVVEMFLGAAAE